MQRLLHANGWIAIFLWCILSIWYYLSFFDQLPSHTFLWWIAIMSLILCQIRGSVAMVWLLLWLTQKSRNFIVKFIAKIIAFLILAMMMADAIMLFLFNMKFSLSEWRRLLVSWGFEKDALISFNTVIRFILSVVVSLVIIYAIFLSKKVKKVWSWLMILLVIWIIWSIVSASFLRYLSGPYLWSLLINPILYNINEFLSDQQLTSSDSETTVSYDSYFRSTIGNHKKKNIIVIFAESFEPKYSSANSSGLYDYLPKFDALQKDGIKYTNFFAPWCVSEHAHISFLQWLFPISYGWAFQNKWYQRFDGYVDSLPTFLNNYGYDTTFLSTVSLKFLNQYSYLDTMWFTNIIGDEVFHGIKDYTFLAAPDKSLYSYAFNLVEKKLESTQPFFLNVQTISTHLPWNTPYGKTEKDAWRYADDTLSNFYSQLRQTDFFDNGILIIFWDHRVPVPSTSIEQQQLWSLRPAKVLATVIGKEISSWSLDERIVQPIDLHFSLKRLIADGKIETRKYYNDIFIDTTQRDRWLHYCKYSSNQISLLSTTWLVLLEDMSDHPAYDFVKVFQSFQFQNSIVSGSFMYNKKDIPLLTGLQVFGHAWSPAYAPSNTMSWFLTALSHGANGIELDLSYTADKVNVVRHWPYPTTSCLTGDVINNLFYEDMRKRCKTDNMESILTFDELLYLTKNIVPVYLVELKVYNSSTSKDQMLDAIATVRKYNLTDKVIFMTYDPVIRSLLTQRSWIRVAWDMFAGDEYPSEQEVSKIEYLMTPFDVLTWKHLQQLLSYHKPIITYTPLSTWDIQYVLTLPISWLLVDDIPKLLKTAR